MLASPYLRLKTVTAMLKVWSFSLAAESKQDKGINSPFFDVKEIQLVTLACKDVATEF